jgi:hypothetical protein
MRCVNTNKLSGGGGIKENDGGVNLTKIYCKHFVHVTVYPQYTIIIKKIFLILWVPSVPFVM